MMLDRSQRRLLGYAGVGAVLLGALSTAALGLSCSGPLSDTCAELRTCDAGVGADASADGAADAGADGADASAAGADARADGPADAARACDPTKDPKDEPCVLDNAYGVFVAALVGVDGGLPANDGGSASGDGTASRPYTTIGQALSNVGSKTRVYVCNGTYREQVNITTAVTVYGGLSCAAGASGRVWTYAGVGAQVISPSPAYALSVSGVSSGVVTIEDTSFASPDATAAGTSSIAALVASSSVHLVRVTLTAGSGATGVAGADGTTNPNYTGPAPDGGTQVWGYTSGLFGATSGGTGGINACSRFGSSAGGHGGLGCAIGLGTAGIATPSAPVSPGRDGLPMGQTVLSDAGAVIPIVANDPGADGVAGSGGAAAPPQPYGTLSSTGWTPPSLGGDGAPGNPGQGGAGATDPLNGQCNSTTQDIGGGGGGAGGCGGAGGQGGGGGGASMALASIGGTIQLTACTLVAAAGGSGGAGGAGQDGQAGGAGGDANFSGAHAAGAAGGNGAGGSGGAGGTGGISVGILESSSVITTDTATTQSTRLGAAGAGGAAGLGGRHGPGALLTTGMDGSSGATGGAGTSVALLKLM